jgi:hypothetical protein
MISHRPNTELFKDRLDLNVEGYSELPKVGGTYTNAEGVLCRGRRCRPRLSPGRNRSRQRLHSRQRRRTLAGRSGNRVARHRMGGAETTGITGFDCCQTPCRSMGLFQPPAQVETPALLPCRSYALRRCTCGGSRRAVRFGRWPSYKLIPKASEAARRVGCGNSVSPSSARAARSDPRASS